MKRKRLVVVQVATRQVTSVSSSSSTPPSAPSGDGDCCSRGKGGAWGSGGGGESGKTSEERQEQQEEEEGGETGADAESDLVMQGGSSSSSSSKHGDGRRASRQSDPCPPHAVLNNNSSAKDVKKTRGSMLQEILRVVHQDGWRALFRGLEASLVGTTVSQGVYFYLYSRLRRAASEALKKKKKPRKDGAEGDVGVVGSLVVAALAGMGNVLLTNPIWMIATRMQSHQKTQCRASGEHAPGPVAVAKSVYSEYGLGGFWNGVGASLIMVVNPTIQYALYEWMKAGRGKLGRGGGMPRVAYQSSTPHRPSAMEVFWMSALAKAGATILTYPMLTVKTRMMSARRGDAHMQYSSVLDAVLQIAKREGECM